MRAILTCFLWQLGFALARQQFSKQPQYTEVNPEETVILECKVLNKQGQCSWQRDDKQQAMFNDKYKWHGSQDEGDCSLQILNASILYDDATWKCQVTASSWQERDELTSVPAKVVVRVAPTEPIIEYDTKPIPRGANLTVTVNTATMVKCTSRYGNPPALLKWYMGNDELSADQSNNTEVDGVRKNKTWSSVSVLERQFSKADRGKFLRCLAFHGSFEKLSKEIVVNLNVQYPPTAIVYGEPRADLEDKKDGVTLMCVTDANPPAQVSWMKNGINFEQANHLQFSPVLRENNGSYRCEAKNHLGVNITRDVIIDVKYPARILRIFPLRIMANVSNTSNMTCLAEGNPTPKYQWLHSLTGNPDLAVLAGQNAYLELTNVTYENQGKYVCIVSNTINTVERRQQSEEITVHVEGPPQQFTTNLGSGEQKRSVEKGEDAKLDVQFCANPPPTFMEWECANLKLQVGEGSAGKYVAKPLVQLDNIQSCYSAVLIVQKSDIVDATLYTFHVKNARGEHAIPVTLQVEEPISMASVITIIIFGLVFLVLIVVLFLYAFKSEKCCFKKKITPVMDVASSNSASKDDVDMNGTESGLGAIPPDALYTVPTKSRKNPLEDISEYDSMMSESNDTNNRHNGTREIVYADLDIAKHPSPVVHARVTRKDSPTEYARIQYRPQPHERAEI